MRLANGRDLGKSFQLVQRALISLRQELQTALPLLVYISLDLGGRLVVNYHKLRRSKQQDQKSMEESRGEASKPAVPFLLGVERGLEALGERLPWALLPDGLDHHLLLHRRRHPLPAASGRVGRRGAAGRRIWLYGGGGDQITDLVEETRGGGGSSVEHAVGEGSSTPAASGAVVRRCGWGGRGGLFLRGVKPQSAETNL